MGCRHNQRQSGHTWICWKLGLNLCCQLSLSLKYVMLTIWYQHYSVLAGFETLCHVPFISIWKPFFTFFEMRTIAKVVRIAHVKNSVSGPVFITGNAIEVCFVNVVYPNRPLKGKVLELSPDNSIKRGNGPDRPAKLPNKHPFRFPFLKRWWKLSSIVPYNLSTNAFEPSIICRWSGWGFSPPVLRQFFHPIVADDIQH